MVQRGEELVDRVRPERVAHLGSIKGNPYDGSIVGPVIGDVCELEALHRMPEVRRKRAGHAPKLAGDTRQPCVSFVKTGAPKATSAFAPQEGRQGFQPANRPSLAVWGREKRLGLALIQKASRRAGHRDGRPARASPTNRSEGAVIPLRQAGPRRPTPSTLHADDAFPGARDRLEFPPIAGLSPSDPPHLS